jgi:serine/threonine protein kinase
MSSAATDEFLLALRQHHLLEPAQLDEVVPLARLAPRALAAELIRRDWLTPYQANQVLGGRARDLLLGSYVLLERLGAGGMGAVFKARNWKLGRVAALKLIRKERLANEDAVRRFRREIRAAAQLTHPNIVHAYDADEVEGTHFFVMEYVVGRDLARVVKEQGPLPFAAARRGVRQP